MSYKTYTVREYFNGTIKWFQGDKLHRKGGPAIERTDGTKMISGIGPTVLLLSIPMVLSIGTKMASSFPRKNSFRSRKIVKGKL